MCRGNTVRNSLNCIAPPIIVRYNIIMSMEANSVGSERLRRALERNRAKRTRQDGGSIQSRLARRPLPGRTVMKTPASRLPHRPEPTLEKNTTLEASTTPPRIHSPKLSRFFSGLWEYLLRLTWLFCGVLILRLVFTNGGVVDFYAKKDHLESREREHLSIKSENKEILKEIDKIKNSPEYQKKLVRGHLDFIAPDEFLVLFAKEGGRKAP